MGDHHLLIWTPMSNSLMPAVMRNANCTGTTKHVVITQLLMLMKQTVEIMDLRPLPSKKSLTVLQPCTTSTIFPTKLVDLLWYPMMMTKKMATDISWLVVLEVLVILHFQPKERQLAPFLLPIANKKKMDFL